MAKLRPTMPLQVTRTINLQDSGWMLLAAFVFEIVTQLAAPPPDLNAYIHSTSFQSILLVLTMLTLVILISARRQTLSMSENGIILDSAHRCYVYNWRDITELSNTNRGVRLSMAGQSTDQNSYNVIPVPFFGINQTDLRALIEQGIRQWGGGSTLRPLDISYTPGSEARKLIVSQYLKGWLILSLFFVSLFLWLIVPMAINSMNDAILAQRGLRINADVVRVYAGDCSKNGCAQKIEYAFEPQGSSRRLVGYSRVGPENGNANNKAYLDHFNTVPVVYDPTNINRFALNFRDRIFNTHPWRSLISISLILFAMMTVCYGFFIIVFWNAWRKDIKKFPSDEPSLTTR